MMIFKVDLRDTWFGNPSIIGWNLYGTKRWNRPTTRVPVANETVAGRAADGAADADLVLGDGVGRLLDFDQAHGAEGAAEERVLVADAHHLAMAADAQALQVQRSAVDPLHDRCQRKAKPTRLLSP